MSRKKLVYILHDIMVGGVEVALLSAIPELNRQYDLTVVVLGNIDGNLVKGLSAEEKKVFIKFDYKVYLYPFKLKTITDFIVGLSPEYLVCSLWRASWVGTAVKKKMPSVKFFSFIHSAGFFHFADSFFSSKAIKKADYVWADSTSTFTFIKNRFGIENKIRVISLLTRKTPVRNEVMANRQGLEKKQIKFLFLGRINQVKNVPLAVKLVKGLEDKGYDVLFDIYGRKEEGGFDEANRVVQELKLESKVSFKGEVDPVHRFELFPRYDFYLQLSDVEGMAMSVAEAMQNGLVCIVTPVGEIPNYAEDMKSAIFVHAAGDKEWEQSLQKVESVLADTKLYTSISESCFTNFSNKKTYTESVIENLENG